MILTALPSDPAECSFPCWTVRSEKLGVGTGGLDWREVSAGSLSSRYSKDLLSREEMIGGWIDSLVLPAPGG